MEDEYSVPQALPEAALPWIIPKDYESLRVVGIRFVSLGRARHSEQQSKSIARQQRDYKSGCSR